MKASEVRLGNLIYFKGSIKKIIHISELGVSWYNPSDIGFAVASCSVSLDSVDPIPLTQKRLLKFGFIKKTSQYPIPDGSCYFEIKGKMTLNVYEDKSYVFGVEDEISENSICIELKYVHQLQNLWFTLYGEELGINVKLS